VPAAGWYPDPHGAPGVLRWWDGAQWTEHRATPDTQLSATAHPTPSTGVVSRLFAGGQAKQEQRAEFERHALAAVHGDAQALAALPAAVAAARQVWRPKQLEQKLWDAFTVAVRNAVSDDVVTPAEEQHIAAVAGALGIDMRQLGARAFPLFEELVIAGINDGRLPRLSQAPIMLKRDEIPYASFGCSLMKEVALREFRAGTSSVSIPLGAGVRYRVGGVRGRSVVVGTQLVAEDVGVLTVTSTRSVFAGQKKTLEFRHDKLVGMEQYVDGLRLNVSNRQAASLLKTHPGESASIAAAVITAAVSRL
jgi:hypothetical protein